MCASRRTSKLLLLEVTCMSREKFLENFSLKLAGNDNYIHQHEISPPVMTKNSICWDISPCSLCSLCCLLHAAFIFWLIIRCWRWRRHVPPKRPLIFNGLLGIVSHKVKTLHEVVGWGLGAIHGVRVGEQDLGCFGRWVGYQLDETSIGNCEMDSQQWLTSFFR
jgi:hypothetical protein